MKQIAILPSGGHVREATGDTLFFNNERIFYASTLAIYILNAHTFSIEKILPCGTKTINCISVAPHDNNLVAASCVDGFLCVWNIDNEEMVSKIAVPMEVNIVWDPFCTSEFALISKEPNALKVFKWNTTHVANLSKAVFELFSVRSPAHGLEATVARFNPHTSGILTVGCSTGSVVLFNAKTKSQQVLFAKDRSMPVVDLQWDRLSSVYLLVAYTTYLALWDTESCESLHIFDTQHVHMSSLAWMDWTAGGFVTASAKNGTVKIWNAGQKAPLKSVKVSDVGIGKLCFSRGKQRLLTLCTDGSIRVFNMQNDQVEFSSSAGHTDTIFCCKYSPLSPHLFATCSFDGTVKVWNVGDLSLRSTLHGGSEILYWLDWSPKATMIAAVNNVGMLILWDVESGRELARFCHHSKASYSVAWNMTADNLIATTSSDGSLVVLYINYDELYDPQSSSVPTGSRRKGAAVPKSQLARSDIRFQFTHPAPVFGVAWNPSSHNILATACQDKRIRIFNHMLAFPMIQILEGHTARVFSLAWSSINPQYLASGSDDMTIKIWRVDLEKAQTQEVSKDTGKSEQHLIQSFEKSLAGHQGYVRALCWSTEHRNSLFSGSWDGTIRVWDVRECKCLLVVRDHMADVYAISTHPSMPFTFISCSRDTTVRVWEMDAMYVTLRYESVWNCSLKGIVENSSPHQPAEQMTDRMDSSRALSITESMIEFGKSATLSKLITLVEPEMRGAESLKLHNETLRAGVTSNPTSSGDLAALSEGKSPHKGSAGSGAGTVQPLLKFRSIPGEKLILANVYYKFFTFYNGSSGVMDIWENVLHLLSISATPLQLARASSYGSEAKSAGSSPAKKGGSSMANMLLRPAVNRVILPESELLSKARTESRMLEANSASKLRKNDPTGPAGEQMRVAATAFARTGDFLKYCNIMIELNDWTSALAMAPCVSMEYWKSLSSRYAQYLIEESSENCVPYLLGIGKDADAVEFYLNRQESSKAILVAKMSEQRTDLIPDHLVGFGENSTADISSRHPTSATNSATTVEEGSRGGAEFIRERTTREQESSRIIVQVAASSAAVAFLNKGQPLLAAAQFVAVDNIQAAVTVLTNNAEHDMAYALALCFDLDTSAIVVEMAYKCAGLNCITLACDMLSTLDNAEVEIGLMLSKYCGVSASKTLLINYGLQQTSFWLARAKEEENIHGDGEAVQSYVLGGDFNKAAEIAIDMLRGNIRSPAPHDLSSSVKKGIKAMKCIKAQKLDEPLRSLFLCYMAWFGAHDAAAIGMWETAAHMLNILVDFVSRCGFPVPVLEVQLQLLICQVCAGEVVAASSTCSYLVRSGDAVVQGELKELDTMIKNPIAMNAAFDFSSSGFNTPSLRLKQLQGGGVGSSSSSSSANVLVGPYSSMTTSIFKEIARIGETFKLPPLGKPLSRRNSRTNADMHSRYEISIDYAASRLSHSVLQGSLLPSSNIATKGQISFISGKRIVGAFVILGGEGSNIPVSLNEAACWVRVNPFSPTMNGEYLSI